MWKENIVSDTCNKRVIILAWHLLYCESSPFQVTTQGKRHLVINHAQTTSVIGYRNLIVMAQSGEVEDNAICTIETWALNASLPI